MEASGLKVWVAWCRHRRFGDCRCAGYEPEWDEVVHSGIKRPLRLYGTTAQRPKANGARRIYVGWGWQRRAPSSWIEYKPVLVASVIPVTFKVRTQVTIRALFGGGFTALRPHHRHAGVHPEHQDPCRIDRRATSTSLPSFTSRIVGILNAGRTAVYLCNTVTLEEVETWAGSVDLRYRDRSRNAIPVPIFWLTMTSGFSDLNAAASASFGVCKGQSVTAGRGRSPLSAVSYDVPEGCGKRPACKSRDSQLGERVAWREPPSLRRRMKVQD